MMGQLSSGQDRLFYSFNVEDHIAKNHLLRSIDRCLDLSDLRHYLAPRPLEDRRTDNGISNSLTKK